MITRMGPDAVERLTEDWKVRLKADPKSAIISHALALAIIEEYTDLIFQMKREMQKRDIAGDDIVQMFNDFLDWHDGK